MVGAGPAGSAAALTLARKGANVLVLEKGKIPGERNMTGGVLFGDFDGKHGMVNLVPDFESRAPLQRKIVSHEVVLVSRPDAKGASRYYKLTKNSLAAKLGFFFMDFETGHDYSVLRRSFDRWFADLAVDAGAMLSTETTAQELIIEGGAVKGVRTPKEDLRANVVIDASGVTSGLVEQAGLRSKLVPRQLYHGIKRVYKLDSAEIEKRFRLRSGEGRSVFFLGEFMRGIGGGAFVYTNRDTLSVGLVVSMESLLRQTSEHFDQVGKLIDVQDEFERHPMVAELLDGADAVEYSAHNIPKGYKCILKRPAANGFMVTGDALGSFVKIGPMIDGMRRAIASGMMAAEAYLQAAPTGSFGVRNLSRYRDLLLPVYEDVNRSGRDSFISESSLVYHQLPGLVFGTRILAKTHRPAVAVRAASDKDAAQRVQEGTSLLTYDEDESYSHILVDNALASRSLTKLWVPACPVNCYTILSSKGVFASFKDLYEHNLAQLKAAGTGDSARRKAMAETRKDVAEAQLKFDHIACVACGTCGAIGPKEMVLFRHEKNGYGVRYKYG